MALFARLKPNHNITVKFVFVSRNQVSCADTHCHMQVVSAGMHVTVGRLEVFRGVLLHGERVHVCTKQNGWAGVCAFYEQGNAVEVLAKGDLTKSLDRAENALLGLRQLECELGNLVQLSANALQGF